MVLAVEVSGDQLSFVNVIGLGLCLLGILGHIVHKVILIKTMTGSTQALQEDEDFNDTVRVVVRSKKIGSGSEPLLNDNGKKWSEGSGSEVTDDDANDVLYQVLQRRDNVVK